MSPSGLDGDHAADNRQNINPNKVTLAVGAVLFIVSSLLTYVPSLIGRTPIIYPMFLSCVALGVIIYAIGGEARVTNRAITITGAGAIAIAFFFVLKQAITEGEPVFHGSLLVQNAKFGSDAANDKRYKPISAVIQFKQYSAGGLLTEQRMQYAFDFQLNAEKAMRLKDEICPSLLITFADGEVKRFRFSSSQTGPGSGHGPQLRFIPADYNSFFTLNYTENDGALYFEKEQNAYKTLDCDAFDETAIKTAKTISSSETNISAPPPVTLPPPAAPSVTPTSDPTPQSASTNPTSPSPTPPPPSPEPSVERPAAVAEPTQRPPASPEKVIGYVIFSQLSRDFKTVVQTFSTIEGKPNARFPVPNDIITCTTTNRIISAEPYHWDDVLKKHIVSKRIDSLPLNARAVVGGDAIIAKDDDMGGHYVIVPIVDVIGRHYEKKQVLYPPAVLPPNIKGYAYLGFLEKDGSAYAERTFSNYSRPDSLYPLPGDILVATSNVWLRQGPRRWDPKTQDYVDPATVAPIKRGQYVRVGGDTVLAQGGTAIYAPISDIDVGNLAQMAK